MGSSEGYVYALREPIASGNTPTPTPNKQEFPIYTLTTALVGITVIGIIIFCLALKHRNKNKIRTSVRTLDILP